MLLLFVSTLGLLSLSEIGILESFVSCKVLFYNLIGLDSKQELRIIFKMEAVLIIVSPSFKHVRLL